jgi:hypothetical protein
MTAGLWLETGEVDVAVVAASEELDPAVIEVALRMGWGQGGQPVMPAEGAVAFALRTKDGSGKNGAMRLNCGIPWGRGKETPGALARVLEEFPSEWRVWDGFHLPPGPARRAWDKKPPLRRYLPDDKPYLGEAHAASAGWGLCRMLTGTEIQEGPVILPLLGASHQVGALAWAPEGK